MSDAGTVFGMPDEALSIEGVEALTDDPIEETDDSTKVDPAFLDQFKTDAPDAEAEPEAPETEAAEAEQSEVEGEAEESPEGETSDEAEQWYEFAGRRFTSQEEAERSYAEMQGLQSRTVEQQRAMEAQYQQRMLEFQQREQEVANFLRDQVAPLVQQQQAAPKVPGPGDPEFDFENPQHIDAYVNSRIQQGVQAATGQMQQQFDQRLQQTLTPMQQQWQAQQAQAAQAAVDQTVADYLQDIDSWRTEHPEVTVGSPTEAAVAGVLQGLAAIQVGPSRQMLSAALDATRSPALYNEMQAEAMRVAGIAQAARVDPRSVKSLFDDEQGLATMYHRARLAPQGTQAGGRSPQETQARRPHVETGGNGAPVDTAPGQVPDELDEAFKAYHGDEKKKSPLFAGGL